MTGVYRFLKSTVIGGVFVLAPLILLAGMAAWAVNVVITIGEPALAWLPARSIGGISLTVACALVAVAGVCFLAGLFAETAVVRGFGDRAEQIALSVPGYALMKSVGASLVGAEGKTATKTVLARFEASWQLGFLMDTLDDGRLVVFVPGVPRALVGTLHILDPDRVELLDFPVSKALDALGRLGVGLRDLKSRLHQSDDNGARR